MRFLAIVAIVACGTPTAPAETLAPVRLLASRGAVAPPAQIFSEQTRKVAIEVDRDSARVVTSRVVALPFARSAAPEPPLQPVDEHSLQLELVLHGASATTFTERVVFGPLCFEHPGWTEPHIEGDTILLHRDTFVIDLPVVAGLDRVEIAAYRGRGESLARVVLGDGPVSEQRLVEAPLTSGKVSWPEDFDDDDVMHIYSDPGDIGRRTTIVIVPDGYTYAEKSLIKTHADQMVAFFRNKTPYKEHDPFVTYVLIYAYSNESGTDQCDCAAVRDTAMATAFPAGHPVCGHSENRCLFYGNSSCDPTAHHLVEAEARVPSFNYSLGDRTIVMVNTTRYGGCGGTRAVYSAGNGSATEVAVHELGHAFASLADEYTSQTGCGGSAGGVNTSTNAVTGAWPEWIAELGPPSQGAQYWTQCVYRPQASCEMRTLGPPFCAVCNQQFARVFFGKPRVAPTAPLASVAPLSPATAYVDEPKGFSVGTRFAVGPNVTNDIQWSVRNPGDAGFTPVASSVTSISHSFPAEGTGAVRCTITADTNFIKPAKNAANVDTFTWTVNVTVTPPGEVSPAGAAQPVAFATPTSIVWDAAAANGSTTFEVYRGNLAYLALADYGACLVAGLQQSQYDDPALPDRGDGFQYLVAGRTTGGRGPLGNDSAGTPRAPSAPCP